MISLGVADGVVNACLLGARFSTIGTFFSFKIRASDVNPRVSSSSTANIRSKRIRLSHVVSTHNSSTVRMVVLIVVVSVEVALSLDVISHELTVRDITSFGGSAPNTLKEILCAC